MIGWVIDEWRARRFGALIVGGQVMLAEGLREQTKDVDSCLPARQCPRMLQWLTEKDRAGIKVDIRAGSAPLHPAWLGRGCTFHVELGSTDRLDFFGVPLRAPNRIVERFFNDPTEVELASLSELGNLKRTERAQDWADIDLIVGRLRERQDEDGTTLHLFGNALAEEILKQREQEVFRRTIASSQQALERPILRLGLIAPVDELRAMARAERRFWEVAGALRSDQIRDILKRFWRAHLAAIKAGVNFEARHATLLRAAQADLPLSPISDPESLIERARTESGADRWAELLPATRELVAQYFPEYRVDLGTRLRAETKP